MSDKKKLLFITACTPFGKQESFILQEARLVKELYKDFLIIPRNPPKEIFHQKGCGLVDDTIWLPLFSFAMAVNMIGSIFSKEFWGGIGDIVRHSRNIKICMKNLIILPKAFYIARLLKKHDVGHIHAHWASTTSTMAYMINRMTGIPYSFTMHRWDIYENNMLKEKVRTACFARCISKKGREDVLSIVGHGYGNKVHVVHVGVEIPPAGTLGSRQGPFVMMTPANLLPVKGHRYLIDACQKLKKEGSNFEYWIVGDGPLEDELKHLVKDKGVEDRVFFLGRLAHEKVIQMYKDKLVHMVVLPSIDCNDIEREGIPVALMEAMSYGIPVVSTNTGAITELIGDGSGVMVGQKDGILLAQAIEKLVQDKEFRLKLGLQGRNKIEKEFNITSVADTLINMMGMEKQEARA